MHLSQEALAKKSGVSAQQIWRIETGKQQTVRALTVERLARAFGVASGILTGQHPSDIHIDTEVRTLDIHIDTEVRNAFTLAARRYGIPMERIVELAPFLFVVAAERSLERRRARLTTLKDALDRADAVVESIIHLPRTIGSNAEARDAIHAEEKSIADGDILAEDLVFRWGEAAHRFDTEEENPFISSLQEDAIDPAMAEITNFSCDAVRIRVCHAEAVRLADGDEKLGSKILDGWATIDDMPPDLLEEGAVKGRLDWIRKKTTENEKASELAMSRLRSFSVVDGGAGS